MELNCEECAPKADLMQMLKMLMLHLYLAELEKDINTFAALAFGTFTFMIHISGILTDLARTEKGIFCSSKYASSDVFVAVNNRRGRAMRTEGFMLTVAIDQTTR